MSARCFLRLHIRYCHQKETFRSRGRHAHRYVISHRTDGVPKPRDRCIWKHGVVTVYTHIQAHKTTLEKSSMLGVLCTNLCQGS